MGILQASPTPGTQKKGYHTLTGLRRHRLTRRVGQLQRRNLYLTREQGLEMLKEHAIRVGEEPSGPEFTLYLSIDRTLACPCFIVYPSNKSAPYKIPFSYENPEFHRDNTIPKKIASFLQLPEASSQSIWDLIRQLWGIFKSKEAFLLEVRASLSPKGVVVVHDTRFGFDDAAFHSAGRQKDVHALRDPKREVPEEAWATKQGIIYVKYALLWIELRELLLMTGRLEGEGSIGTLGELPSSATRCPCTKVGSQWRWTCHEHCGRLDQTRRPPGQFPRHGRQGDCNYCQGVLQNPLLGSACQDNLCQHLRRPDEVRHDCRRDHHGV